MSAAGTHCQEVRAVSLAYVAGLSRLPERLVVSFVASQFAWNSAPLPTGTALLQAEFLALYTVGFGIWCQRQPSTAFAGISVPPGTKNTGRLLNFSPIKAGGNVRSRT